MPDMVTGSAGHNEAQDQQEDKGDLGREVGATTEVETRAMERDVQRWSTQSGSALIAKRPQNSSATVVL